MIRMKRRSILKQYLQNKPSKWGIKLFAACDVDTGYLFNMNVYTGANPHAGELGLSRAVVLDLLEKHHGQHYIAYTDNFYTSPALADSLQECGIELVGTLRVNRAGVPQILKEVKEFKKKAKRGDIWYVRDFGKLFLQWKDKRVVSMMSTYHSGTRFSNVQRNAKKEVSMSC